MTDLPAPPLVEKTVMTSAELRRRARRTTASSAAAAARVSTTRRTASASCDGVDRRRQHVADAGAERLTEQFRDSSGAIRMAPISGRSPMSFSAAASPSWRGTGRTEHGDEGDAREPLTEQLDAGHRDGEVAELHRQPTPDRLVRVDHRDRGAQTPDRTGQRLVVTFG